MCKLFLKIEELRSSPTTPPPSLPRNGGGANCPRIGEQDGVVASFSTPFAFVRLIVCIRLLIPKRFAFFSEIGYDSYPSGA